ncbi:glycosyltransferase family 4 protein [Lachnospiraceae bacterium 62-35]
MKRLLIVGEIPAPYRVQVFIELSKRWNTKIYFESAKDEKQHDLWLQSSKLSCEILDNKLSIQHFLYDIAHVQEYNLVLLYNNCLKYSMLLEIVCKIKKIPYFINCDGCNDIKESNLLKRRIKDYFMQGAVGYFAGGKIAREYFEYHGADISKVYIHNFTSLNQEDIDKEVINSAEKRVIREKLSIHESFIIISVGRHIPCKGFDVLVKAAQYLGNEIGLYIIGGKPSGDIQKYCRENKISNVHFLDFMDKKGLKEYYRASDVFTLMTRGDTWGLVVNEAMANGLPVITTNRCVAGKELIEEGVNGYIIDVDDLDSLIDRIIKLKKNHNLRNNMADSNICKIQKYTLKNMADINIRAIEDFFNQNNI